MGREEQIEEREVLDSIFPDEIADISETSYRVAIALDVPGQQVEDESQRPTINLTVSYPPAYPDIAPELSLSHPPNAPKPPHLSFPTDSAHLLSLLEPMITDSLGTVMIFTLITTLKEETESLIAERMAAVDAESERAARAEEEKENAKFYGEKVTRERFLEWRTRFQEEMERKREEDEERRREEEGAGRRGGGGGGGKGAPGGKEEKKMTGRELWEKGLVGRVDEEGDVGADEQDALAAGAEGLHVKD